MPPTPSDNLFGIVDLGTWTIRFSINSVNPVHARILPCVFQDKAPIHLYKGPGVPITPDEIKETILCLARFRSICRDYGVPRKNVRIAANPNEAPNFDELVSAIQRDIGGVEVLRLSREGEHCANAHAIASAFHMARGLYIELRPAVVNVYYLCFSRGGKERVDGPLRVPYTTAAGSADGKQAASDAPVSAGMAYLYGPDEQEPLGAEFAANLRRACEQLLSEAAVHEHGALVPSNKVYLSGSGFPGLHSVLATVDSSDVLAASTGLELTPDEVANIAPSSRLALILRAIGASLPNQIERVLYARHNLRNGLLFQALPAEIKCEDPLVVATRPYALPGAPQLAAELVKALPKSIAPAILRERIVPALANAAYIHSSYGNVVQPKSALVVAHTGLFGGTHGLTHEDRVLLGLALCERWGGQLDPRLTTLRNSMVSILYHRRLGWWARYLGLVLHLLGAAFPGAHVRSDVVGLRSSVQPNGSGLKLEVNFYGTSIYSSNIIIRQRFEQVLRLLRQLGADFGSDAVPLEVVHGTGLWE